MMGDFNVYALFFTRKCANYKIDLNWSSGKMYGNMSPNLS